MTLTNDGQMNFIFQYVRLSTAKANNTIKELNEKYNMYALFQILTCSTPFPYKTEWLLG